jgi:hypothetical protein
MANRLVQLRQNQEHFAPVQAGVPRHPLYHRVELRRPHSLELGTMPPHSLYNFCHIYLQNAAILNFRLETADKSAPTITKSAFAD